MRTSEQTERLVSEEMKRDRLVHVEDVGRRNRLAQLVREHTDLCYVNIDSSSQVMTEFAPRGNGV